MDRFIEHSSNLTFDDFIDLKSNMDRFIEDKNELFRKEYGI